MSSMPPVVGARRALLLGPAGPALRGLRWARAAGLECVALVGRGQADPRWAELADDLVDAPVDPRGAPTPEGVADSAVDAGCDLVLPGWGELSSSGALGETLASAGVGWAGPSPRAAAALGDPVGLWRIAAELGVPTVPARGPCGDAAAAEVAVQELGVPMRIFGVQTEVCRTSTEAAAAVARALGQGPVWIEREVEHARVLDVPVLADGRGGARVAAPLELSARGPGGRLLVEGPAGGAPAAALLEAWAAALTGAIGLRGLAALRLLRGPDGRWALLRLRVGLAPWHGLTELLHGVDLVDAQARLALGDELPAALPPAAGAAVHTGLRAVRAGVVQESPDDGLRRDPELAPGEAAGAGAWVGGLAAHGPTRGAALVRLRVALAAGPFPGVDLEDGPLLRLLDAPGLWRSPLDRDAVAALLRAGGPIAPAAAEG